MGMTASTTEIEREALNWLVRVNDPAFAAWDDWERWLAADARHAEAYWRLAAREADVVEALTSAPRRAAAPIAKRRRVVVPRRAMAAAAVAVAAIGIGWFAWTERPQPWSIETAPGELRTVTLADGSRVSLAGSTRLSLDRGEPREAVLDRGRALFEVVHDARRPFRVAVGDAALTDLGTTFDVTRLQEGVRVAVSEGVVRVDQQGASETVEAGEGVIAGPGGMERRAFAVESVAGWRDGRLSYTNETLAVVAQDLERALDRPVRAAPSVAGRRFSGSLSVQAPPQALRTRLARLLGVSIVEDGEAWRLEP